MKTETMQLMTKLVCMSKGELVNIIDGINDDLNDVSDKLEDAKAKLNTTQLELESTVKLANRWKEDYQMLWDLVELGATIKDGKLSYDEGIKLKYCEYLLSIGGPLMPVERQLGLSRAWEIRPKKTEEEAKSDQEKLDNLRKQLKRTDLTEGERARLLKQITDMIRGENK